MSRAPRAAETREMSSKRPAPSPFKSKLDFDVRLIPAGMKACWIRESTYGQLDDDNVESMMADRGFTLATTDQFPQLARPVIPGREKKAGNLVRIGGMLLGLRPKETDDEERALLASTNEERRRGVNRIAPDTNAKFDRENFVDNSAATEQIEVHRKRAFPE